MKIFRSIKIHKIIKFGLSSLFLGFFAHNLNTLYFKNTHRTFQTDKKIKIDPQIHKSTIILPAGLSSQQTAAIKKMFHNYRIIQTQNQDNCIIMVNTFGQYRQFMVKDNQNIVIKEDWLFKMINFNNPPYMIKNSQELNKLLNGLEKDENMILTYIPQQQQYKKYIGEMDNPHDRYSLRKVKNLNEIYEEFKNLKYDSVSCKNCFVIIKAQELANKLNLQNNSIGNLYFLRKTSYLINNQSNFLYNNTRYIMNKIQINVNNPNQVLNYQFKKDFILNNSISYLNQIHMDNDIENFLRQIKQTKSKKVFVISINDQKQDFIKNIQKILIDVKKILKNDVYILISKNKNVLQNYFHIQLDDFVTIRLIDFNSTQKPMNIFSQYENPQIFNSNTSNYFPSRYKYRGPFKYTELIEFIKNPKEQYYQQKQKLKLLQSIFPNQINEVEGIVIFQKKGCKGCDFYNSILQELQNIIHQIKSNGPKTQQFILKYRITNHQSLKKLKIYRYNILNENPSIKISGITPQIYYFKNGMGQNYRIGDHDIRVEQIIQKIIKFVQDTS